MTLFAQVAEVTSTLDALKPYGIAGIMVAFLMGRDVWKDNRDAKREDQRNKERDELWKQVVAGLESNTTAIGYLIRATTAEVLSRPNVATRTQDEMHEINRALAREKS